MSVLGTKSLSRKKLIFGILAIILIFATASIVWLWRKSYRDLEARIERLRSQGYPTTPAARNDYYAIPDGQVDCSKEWVRAFESVVKNSKAIAPKSLQYGGSVQNPIPAPGKFWKEQQATAEFLAGFEPEMARLRKAARLKGRVRYPIDLSLASTSQQLMDHLQLHMHGRRLLELDSNLCSHQGRHQQILENVITIIRMGRILRDEPCMWSLHFSQSLEMLSLNEIERWISYCEWSDADLAHLQQQLIEMSKIDHVQRALAGDLAEGIVVFRSNPQWAWRPTVAHEYLTLMEEAIESFDHPWPEPLHHQRAITARLSDLQKQPLSGLQYSVVLSYGGSIEQAGQMTAKLITKQRCTCLLIAAQRFRLAQGRLPASFQEIKQSMLVPSDFGPETFHDPFNGALLLFSVMPDGIVIYSVGDDLTDNGGDIFQHDGRFWDIGFKLLTARVSLREFNR